MLRGKSWCWRFRFRGKSYGKCGDERTGQPFKTAAQAREAGEQRKAEVVAGFADNPRETTFAALEETIRNETTLQSEHTKSSADGAIKRLKRYFRSDELVMDINRSRLLGYVAFCKAEPYKAQLSTIKLDLKFLRRAMKAAHDDGLILRMPPFPQIKVLPRAETFRPDEFERLVAALPEWWRRFFVVADEMGWRENELRSRKRTDVNFEEGYVHLDAASSKSRKERWFPLTEFLAERLRDQIAYVQAVEERTGRIVPHLFCQPDGRPLGRPKDAWKRACVKAGFGKLDGRRGPWSNAKVAHDIRRTTLRRWDRLMLPLGGRMAAAGHDSQTTHGGYLGGDPETMRAMVQRLDEDRRRRAGETAKVVPIKKADGQP